jgi:hypothetical protein
MTWVLMSMCHNSMFADARLLESVIDKESEKGAKLSSCVRSGRIEGPSQPNSSSGSCSTLVVTGQNPHVMFCEFGWKKDYIAVIKIMVVIFLNQKNSSMLCIRQSLVGHSCLREFVRVTIGLTEENNFIRSM